MSIWNNITKIVDKYGRITDFKVSKITNSIILTILDVENTSRWIAERRARKYAEVIRSRIYEEFYDINWLIRDFIRKFTGFKPDERVRRLNNAFITERFSIVLVEKFKENTSGGGKMQLLGFIKKEIEKSTSPQGNDAELFPVLDDKLQKVIIDFIFEKAMHYSEAELTAEQVYPSREYIMDMIEKTLKEIGETEIAESFMIFREGKNKIKKGEISKLQFTNNGIHYGICRRILEWNIENECENLFGLNDWVCARHGKDIRTLIKLSEGRFVNDVNETIKKILNRKDEIKMIIIAGPSCSNKTTATVIIGKELSKVGLKLRQLNVDDYFKNLEDQPKDEFGDYDFEMPDAIDIELLNEDFKDLLKGKTVKKPHYNFKTGKRDSFTEFYLKDDEILLIDCLHGLYKSLTRSVGAPNKFSIYIESMNILRNIDGTYTRWADIRMMKRMIRDYQHRGYSMNKTLAHWPYVRKGELKHIIPYIFSTDAVINSGIPYELPVLKKVLELITPDRAFVKQLGNEGRLDPYIRGIRTLTLFDAVEAISDIALVPGTSPLREFIGGSDYVIPHNE